MATLVLVLTYLASTLLQTKLNKSLKTILNYCKVRLISKNRPDWETTFISKIGFPRISLMLMFVSFSVDSVKSYGECVRNLNVRTGVHNGTLSLITKPNNSSLGV